MSVIPLTIVQPQKEFFFHLKVLVCPKKVEKKKSELLFLLYVCIAMSIKLHH